MSWFDHSDEKIQFSKGHYNKHGRLLNKFHKSLFDVDNIDDLAKMKSIIMHAFDLNIQKFKLMDELANQQSSSH